MNGDSAARGTSLLNGEKTTADIMTASCGKQQLSGSGAASTQPESATDDPPTRSNCLSNGSCTPVEESENSNDNLDSKDSTMNMEVDGSPAAEAGSVGDEDSNAAAAVEESTNSDNVVHGDQEKTDGENEKMETDQDNVDKDSEALKQDNENESETSREMPDRSESPSSEHCKDGGDPTESEAEPEIKLDQDQVKDDKKAEPSRLDGSKGEVSPSPSSQGSVSRCSTPSQEVISLGDSSSEDSRSVTPSVGDSCTTTPADSRSVTPSVGDSSLAPTPVLSAASTPQPSPGPGASSGRTTPTPGTSTGDVTPVGPSPGTSTGGSTSTGVSPATSTSDAIPGTSTGGATPGTSTGGATPGTSTGGATTGTSTGGATPGTSTGGATPGTSTGGATPGTSTGGATPGTSTGGATPGTSTGGATPGTSTGGASGATVPSIPGDAATETRSQPSKPSKMDHLLPMSSKEPDLRPMADLLVEIGQSLVCQQVYRDLVRVQRKKKGQNRLNPAELEQLDKMEVLYDAAVELNQPFHLDDVQCSRCGYHTESKNVLELHKEYAHLAPGDIYLCSFCDTTSKNINGFFSHMISAHHRKGRIHMKMSQFICPLCPYEQNAKNVFIKHVLKCQRSYHMSRNLEPQPADSDIPLKKSKYSLPAQPVQPKPVVKQQAIRPYRDMRQPPGMLNRHGNKTVSSLLGNMNVPVTSGTMQMTSLNQPRMGTAAGLQARPLPAGMSINTAGSTQPQYVQLGGQFYCLMMQNGRQMLVPVTHSNAPTPNAQPPVAAAKSPVITPQHGRQAAQQAPASQAPGRKSAKSPALLPAASVNIQSKAASIPPDAGFQICEICGGFVKDRESLRVHFFWAHKVDLPKETFYKSRPHLFCHQCTERFWTYQGLSRHQRVKHPGPGIAKPAAAPPPPKPVVYTCIVCNQAGLSDILHHLTSVHGISADMQITMKTCMICGKALSSEIETKDHLQKVHPEAVNARNKPAAAAATPQRPDPRQKQDPRSTPKSGQQAKPTPTALFTNAGTNGTPAPDNRRKPYCHQCSMDFKSVSEYVAHRHELHTFMCERCPSTNRTPYSTKQALSKHYYSVHGNEVDTCPVCKCSVGIGMKFIDHMTKMHLKKCTVAVKRMSPAQLSNMSKIKKSAPAEADKDEIIVLEDSPVKKPRPAPTAHVNGKRTRSQAMREEIIEVDGEQVIVQQQDSDSDS